MEGAERRKESEEGGRPACPRCGMDGYLEKRRVGGNVYYYYRHVYYADGKRRERRCYLGPDRYIHAEKFNKIWLAGMVDEDRFFRYAEAIIPTLKRSELERLKDMIERQLRAELERQNEHED
jgi:hypothetical protein